MPDEKNFFVGLVDFSFQHQLTPRVVKLLYIVAILGGGIAVVVYTVIGMQQSPAEGVIVLAAGLAALFVGILVVRVQLELALVLLRIAEVIERATHPGN